MGDPLYTDVYPEAWFAILRSSELRRGVVRGVEAFGRALVAFRTASGRVGVTTAHCPHMGASLADGCVVGERLACPFHGWEFDADGACRRIPYGASSRVPAGARVGALPVIERYGWIWIYHGASPAFSLPDVPEYRAAGWSVRRRTADLACHVLVVLENGADVQHLHTVHRMPIDDVRAAVVREDAHDFVIEVRQRLRYRALGTVETRSTLHYVGAAAVFGSLEWNGRPMLRYVVSPLPMGPRRTRFQMTVMARVPTGALRALAPVVASLTAWRTFRGAREDFPIWQAQDPEWRRVLVAEDRLQERFRRHYRRHLPSQRIAA